jgi:hypothetical protein
MRCSLLGVLPITKAVLIPLAPAAVLTYELSNPTKSPTSTNPIVNRLPFADLSLSDLSHLSALVYLRSAIFPLCSAAQMSETPALREVSSAIEEEIWEKPVVERRSAASVSGGEHRMMRRTPWQYLIGVRIDELFEVTIINLVAH